MASGIIQERLPGLMELLVKYSEEDLSTVLHNLVGRYLELLLSDDAYYFRQLLSDLCSDCHDRRSVIEILEQKGYGLLLEPEINSPLFEFNNGIAVIDDWLFTTGLFLRLI